MDTHDSPCVRLPTKQLILQAAKNLLAHRDAGRKCDPSGIAWAEWIVKHNGPPTRPAQEPFTILGEPASKANSRQIVTIGERPAKQPAPREREVEEGARLRARRAAPDPAGGAPAHRGPGARHAADLLRQRAARPRRVDRARRAAGPLEAARCARRRGGESCERTSSCQAGVYRNDRQVREKHVFHAIDREPAHRDRGRAAAGPAAVWGGWFYIVFVLDRSAWWTLLAILCSSATVPVRRWTGQEGDA
jgi:hypothetical protein